MHILVVGGAGYIGSVTSELLRSRGHQVTVFDNLSTGHKAAIAEGATLQFGDIGSPLTLSAQHYDAVMHFAAKIVVPESMTNPGSYFANNTAAVINLLNAAAAAGIRKFVFSSTAAVYGTPSVVPITEDAALQPESPYGTSKLLVEQMLPWYERAHGLRYACLRYFNAASASERYGEDHDPESHLIPLAVKTALGQRQGALTIYGSDYPTPDGTAVRDYIHVLDLADAHVRALEALDNGSLTCNLGSERGYSVQEVVSTTRAVTGVDFPIERGDRRPGDPPSLVASTARASELLGWKATRGLEDMVRDAWRWHKAHPNGYGG